jgi:hypothetical protein
MHGSNAGRRMKKFNLSCRLDALQDLSAAMPHQTWKQI